MENTGKKHIPISTLIYRIITLVVLVFILAGINMTEYGQFTFYGYRPVVVVSGSMLPTVQINSLTIIKDCKVEDIEVGDIVMYYHPNLKVNITHRAIEKYENSNGEECLLTKGDANGSSDGIEVTNDLIRGKMVSIFNEVVPFINLIIQDESINRTAFIGIVVILALAVTSVVNIITHIIRYIYAFIIVSGVIKNKVFKESLKDSAKLYSDISDKGDITTVDDKDGFIKIFTKIEITKKLLDNSRLYSDIKQLFDSLNNKNNK